MYIYNSARVRSDRATKKPEHAPRNLPCAIHRSSIFLTLLHKNLLLDARTHARSQTHARTHTCTRFSLYCHLPPRALLPSSHMGWIPSLFASNRVSVTRPITSRSRCVTSRHASVTSRSRLDRISVASRSRLGSAPVASSYVQPLVLSCAGWSTHA
jgi:hypothetical protein